MDQLKKESQRRTIRMIMSFGKLDLEKKKVKNWDDPKYRRKC